MSNMMTCKELCDFMMSYLDGDLPESQRAVFQKHLDLCPPCKQYMDTYRQTIECEKKACREEEKKICCKIPEELVQAILKARKQ